MKVTYCALFAALASSVASADDPLLKIKPITKSGIKGLRGSVSGTTLDSASATRSEVADKVGFISLPEIQLNSESMEVQFFNDEETFTFVKALASEKKDGFAWYGEDAQKMSSLNLYVNTSKGIRYAGYVNKCTTTYSI